MVLSWSAPIPMAVLAAKPPVMITWGSAIAGVSVPPLDTKGAVAVTSVTLSTSHVTLPRILLCRLDCPGGQDPNTRRCTWSGLTSAEPTAPFLIMGLVIPPTATRRVTSPTVPPPDRPAPGFTAVMSPPMVRPIWSRLLDPVITRSFGAHLRMAGANLADIADLLGQKDLATTQIYAKVQQEHLRSVVGKLIGLVPSSRTDVSLKCVTQGDHRKGEARSCWQAMI